MDSTDPAIKRANVQDFADQVEVIEANIEDAEKMTQVVTGGKFEAIIHIAARGRRAALGGKIQAPTSRRTSAGPTTCWKRRGPVALGIFFLPRVHQFTGWRVRCLSRKTWRFRRP